MRKILIPITIFINVSASHAATSPPVVNFNNKSVVFSADGKNAFDKARCGPGRKPKLQQEGVTGEGYSRTLGPFVFAVGPTADGALGASLKGGDALEFELLNKCSPSPTDGGFFVKPVGRVTYDLDSNISSKESALNASSLTVRPTLALNFLFSPSGNSGPVKFLPVPSGNDEIPTGAQILNTPTPFLFSRPVAAASLFGELRQRFGEIDAGDAGIVRANQFIYGGGAEFAWTGAYRLGSGEQPSQIYGFFRDPPRFRLGYYSATNVNNNTAPIPEEINANYLTVGMDVHVALPWFYKSLHNSPLLLNYEYKGSKATTGTSGYSSYHNIQIAFILDGDIKPVLTYKTGKEQGLEYDKQVILGILIELSKSR